MITTRVGVAGRVYTCHHNEDYSGNVVIDDPSLPNDRIVLPFELMAELVGNMVNEKLRGHLEQMSGKDFIMRVMGS